MTVSIEVLEQCAASTNVREAINQALQCAGQKPVPPHKPILQPDHDIDHIKWYLAQFGSWKIFQDIYQKDLAEYERNKRILNECIENFIKKESGFDSIPAQYQEKVYDYVLKKIIMLDDEEEFWYSLYMELEDLANIFKV
jgi:hypothetical protein